MKRFPVTLLSMLSLSLVFTNSLLANSTDCQSLPAGPARDDCQARMHGVIEEDKTPEELKPGVSISLPPVTSFSPPPIINTPSTPGYAPSKALPSVPDGGKEIPAVDSASAPVSSAMPSPPPSTPASIAPSAPGGSTPGGGMPASVPAHAGHRPR